MARVKKALVLITITVCYVSLSALITNAKMLYWTPSTGNPDGYKVYYGTKPSKLSKFKKVGNVTKYDVDRFPLSENVQYYFAVSAFNEIGESGTTAPVAYTPGDSTPPAPPAGLKASAPVGSSSLVSKLKVKSSRSYRIRSGLSNGNAAYIDRKYKYSKLPSSLQKSTFIMTANDDKASKGSEFLSFNVSRAATIYVAHDDRISPKPKWLKKFTKTGEKLRTDVPMSIYKKRVSKGRVTLGGNGGPRSVSMYTVSIK